MITVLAVALFTYVGVQDWPWLVILISMWMDFSCAVAIQNFYKYKKLNSQKEGK